MLTFKLYCFITILLAGGAIINSATIHEQFYPTIIYLSTQKSNKLVMINFFFMIGIAFFKKLIKLFFGEVREIEKISIQDNLKRKILDVILIIILFKEDYADQSFYIWMIILAFVWILHQLTKKRSEYLIAESVYDPYQHMKLFLMYVLLICIDSLVVRYLTKMYFSTSSEQFGHFILFYLEYILIVLNILFPFIKYTICAFEMFSNIQFQNKNNFLMVLEFIISFTKLTIQLFIRFKFMFFTPFILDLVENAVQLYQTAVKFVSSIKLLRQLNELPDVYLEANQEVDNTCLICLSEIKEGKKIGCGHIFHKNCLKELIQGKSNQLCPKCRQPIQIEKVIQDSQSEQNNKKKDSYETSTIKTNSDSSNNTTNADNSYDKFKEDNKDFKFIKFTFFQNDQSLNEDDGKSQILSFV